MMWMGISSVGEKPTNTRASAPLARVVVFQGSAEPWLAAVTLETSEAGKISGEQEIFECRLPSELVDSPRIRIGTVASRAGESGQYEPLRSDCTQAEDRVNIDCCPSVWLPTRMKRESALVSA